MWPRIGVLPECGVAVKKKKRRIRQRTGTPPSVCLLPPASWETTNSATPVGEPQWVSRGEGCAAAGALVPPGCAGVDH